MTTTLRYGEDATIEFDLPAQAYLADCSTPRVEPIDDTAAAVAAAVEDPIEFPGLGQATVSGDSIAIVLEPGVPRIGEIVAGVVHSLISNGIEPNSISVVQKPTTSNFDPGLAVSMVPPETRDAIQLVNHQPGEKGMMAYLAAAKSGDPIYVNRVVLDSDVVIPIGVFRLCPDLEPAGVHDSLFRTFSNTASSDQSSHSPWIDSRQSRQSQQLADEAGWLLGVQFTIQIIPGPGDEVLHVIAGDTNAVAKRGKQLCEAAWRFDVPKRASLVVATIEGDSTQQTWDNFSRSLSVATRAVADDGSIVICSDLRDSPYLPAFSEENSSTDDPFQEVELDRLYEDQLSAVQERARVFLLSGLDSDLVEEMGMGHIESKDEVARLSQQHDSCILVANAQHAVLVAPDD